jgi:hypothetical protein
VKNTNDSVMAKYLESAQIRLIIRVDSVGSRSFQLTPYISEVERGWDEMIDEGYDDQSPLRCPVHWRIVNRGDERFYWSTFLVTRDHVTGPWGTEGLAHCDRVTGMAVAQIETYLGPSTKEATPPPDASWDILGALGEMGGQRKLLEV